MPYQAVFTQRRRKGVTLLETLLALALLAGMGVTAAYLLNERELDVRDQATANQLAVLDEAAQRFVRDNIACLSSATGAASCPAGAISLPAALSPTGTDAYSKLFMTYLPPNFGRNAYHQTWRLVVSLGAIPSGETTAPLQALVLTGGDNTDPGLTINPARVGHIVAEAGPRSGFLATNNLIQGAYNGWSLNGLTALAGKLNGLLLVPISNSPTATASTSLASFVSVDNGAVFSDWLSRVQIPGHAEANQMETALDMNNHNITNVETLSLNGAAGDGSQNIITTSDGGLVGQGNDLTLKSRSDSAIALASNTVAIGQNGKANDLLIKTQNKNATLDPQGGSIIANTSDMYVGAPTNGNMNGTGTLRAGGISLPGLSKIYVTVTGTNGTTQQVTLDDLMPRYRSVENWQALSGQEVTKPTCVGTGIPQIVTTLHGFEGGVTQDSYNGALDPERTLPMRVRAIDQGSEWQVVIEHLNPYPQCGGGPNVWNTQIIQPNPAGGCHVVSTPSTTSGAYSNEYALVQTYCYYAKEPSTGIPTPPTNPGT